MLQSRLKQKRRNYAPASGEHSGVADLEAPARPPCSPGRGCLPSPAGASLCCAGWKAGGARGPEWSLGEEGRSRVGGGCGLGRTETLFPAAGAGLRSSRARPCLPGAGRRRGRLAAFVPAARPAAGLRVSSLPRAPGAPVAANCFAS